LRDRRASPISEPRTVAATIPISATRSVFAMPTVSASRYVPDALYGTKVVSPIANPASRSRKAKPLAILRSARFSIVFEIRNQPSSSVAAAADTW
jgi:hypothetical protein